MRVCVCVCVCLCVCVCGRDLEISRGEADHSMRSCGCGHLERILYFWALWHLDIYRMSTKEPMRLNRVENFDYTLLPLGN